MSAAAAVADRYDAALFDLDGVVYLGPAAVPGAAEGIAALRERGTRVGFVTNNAARTPTAVATHLAELGIPAAPADVVTAAQAAAHLLVTRFGPGARVLAVSGEGVRAALAEVGLVAVDSADDEPVGIIQGWGVDLTWNQLNEVAIAIHRGAHWVATNLDPTRPTDRGLVPGNGAAVAAVRMAVDVEPEIAGKPFEPLMAETVARLAARRPVFVGDRLDTDVAGARAAGLDAMLVLTGSHGSAELLAAEPSGRPAHVGWDLRDLLAPVRSLEVDGSVARCRDQQVQAVDGRLRLDSAPGSTAEAVDAVWAATGLAWPAADAGSPLTPDDLLDQLAPLLSPDAVG